MPYTPHNPYIPGDPYSYDLKWLVAQVKANRAILETLDERIKKIVTAQLDQHDPVYYQNAQELIDSAQKAPSIAYIEGYYAAGDGGANLYYVTDDYNDVLASDFYITLSGANRWAIPVILTPYVTPEMFGAVGDGAADDTNAVKTAISGHHNIIMSKDYFIGGSIDFADLQDVTITGGSLIFSDLKFTDCSRLKICGVSFLESNKSITLIHCDDVAVCDCFFVGDPAYVSPRFAEIYGGYDITIDNCNIFNSQYAVISRPDSTAPTFKLTVKNCLIENTQQYSYPAGINIAEVIGAVISGNSIHGIHAADTYGYGIYTGDQEYHDPQDVIITDNMIDDCDRGIRFHLIKNVKVTGNTITDCASVSIELLGDASTASADTITDNITISGNTVDNFINIGNHSHHIIVADNVMKRGSIGAMNFGLYLNGDASVMPEYVTVRGNIIIDPQRAGIYVAAGKKVIIDGNEIINANTSATGPVYAQGGIALYITENALVTNNKVESSITALLLNANSIAVIYSNNELKAPTAMIGGYSAFPSSGEWNIGQIGYYQNPSTAGYIGFVCTASGDFGGTPPTFQNFGALV